MAASTCIAALLLGCAALAPGSASSAASRHHRVVVALPAPDLPADLDPSLVDADPVGSTHAALSRIVADPGTVLKTYAPLHAPADESVLPPAPVDPPAKTTASPLPRAQSAALSDAPDARILPPAPSPAPAASSASSVPAASPLPRGAPDDVPVLPGPGDAPPAPLPIDAASTAPATLDPATFGSSLAAFLGPRPEPVAGQVNAAAAARYKERQAIVDFYAARGNAPLWIEDGRFGTRARAVLAEVDHAAEDGLDLRTFPVAVPHAGADAAALASSELALTEAVVAYGRQATGGRIDPSRLAPLIVAKPDVADPGRVLGMMAVSMDPAAALADFNPPQKGYAALKAKLAELRRTSEMAGRDPIPYGPTLKPGMRDARVPLVRARFGLDMPSASADAGLLYDTQVAAAVAGFQRAHHLPPSGLLTIRTVAALSGGDPRRLEDEIVANMERWRWLPRDLGDRHIEVNVPDFSLNVMQGDSVVHHTRVVVGQPDKPTPIFSETMRFIIVNPYWNVPLSIVQKEMLPKLAADPNYFADHGYETVERGGVTYVRQPPGDSNALGRIKFMFPNPYSVYLHDTNARALFGREQRALSHGCVRVEAPFKLAEVVLGRENGWTEARVKKLVGGDERTVNLPAPLPIHIVYFTAFVDESGALRLRDDVYGYSAKVKAALGLAG